MVYNIFYHPNYIFLKYIEKLRENSGIDVSFFDENGEYYWNDAFLFSCDETEPPVNDRERRWQETTELYRSGAFGAPEEDSVRLLFWRRMERLHYPGAGETCREIDRRLREEKSALLSQETRKNPENV